MSRLFAVRRAYGPPYDPAKPLEAQPGWDAHAAYMDAAAVAGRAVLAGPLEGAGEALIIVRAESASDVERWLAEDPWTANGVLRTVSVAAWSLRIGAVEPANPAHLREGRDLGFF